MGQSYSLDNWSYDLNSDAKSWKSCRIGATNKIRVSINILTHGDNNNTYNAIKFLVSKNGLIGDFCIMTMSQGKPIPVWMSKDFSEGEELWSYQSIFHTAGLLILNDGIQAIPGFNSPGEYKKPPTSGSPFHPQFKRPPNGLNPRPGIGTTGTTGGTTASGSAGSIVTPTLAVSSTGEKVKVIVQTDKKTFNYTFYLDTVDVSDVSQEITSIGAISIKALLVTNTQPVAYENITPEELIRIQAHSLGVTLIERDLQQKETLPRIEFTPNSYSLLALAESYNIDLVDDPKTNTVTVSSKDSLRDDQLIISDLLSLSFSDQSVLKELPTYPVSISVATSDHVLKLLPRSKIDLSNVYSFVPDSLKKDSWVINSIRHELGSETSSLELVKYIAEASTLSAVPSSTGGPLTESQLLAKYESAAVKLPGASGFVITSDGYILTAEHVGNDKTVTFKDGRTFETKVIATDKNTDLKLLKIEASGLNFFPIAPDTSIYPGNKEPIYKLGSGWSSEDGRGEGGKERKDFDITASTVIKIENYPPRGRFYVFTDDKTVDFVNPGDSGCPWHDKWGLVVSVTSFGDRSHAQGAGRGRQTAGPDVRHIREFLSANRINFTTGSRTTASRPVTPTVGGGTVGGTSGSNISQKVLASINQLGKFSTSAFFDPRNACAFSINKVITNAGYRKIGANELWVPSVREALQSGRGRKVNRSQVVGGMVVISHGCWHIGLSMSSSTVRSSSSSRQCYCWDSDLEFDGYYNGMSADGYNSGTEYWELLN
ncbi:trypsin-like peptidase domain-containing protein [bacterium]|nr:trypsin-like peptidase domain-containing protein [bacterium]